MVFSFDDTDPHLPPRARGFSVSSHEGPYSPSTESPILGRAAFNSGNTTLSIQLPEPGSTEAMNPADHAPFSPTFSGKPLYGGGRRRASIVAAANSEAAGLDVSAFATSLQSGPMPRDVPLVKGGLPALFSCMEVDSRVGSENESAKDTEKPASVGVKKKRKNKSKKTAQPTATRNVNVSELLTKAGKTKAKKAESTSPLSAKTASSESQRDKDISAPTTLCFMKFPPSVYSTPTSQVSSDIDESISTAPSLSPDSSPPKKGLLRDLLEEQRANTGDVIIVSSETGEPIQSYEVALEHDFISSELRSRPVTRTGSPDGISSTARKRNLAGPSEAPSVSPFLLRHKVCAEDFEVLRCLGKGTYGTVLLVRHIRTGRLYAQKQLKKASIIVTKKLIDQTKAERTILEAVRHPFVVKLYYAFQDHEKLYLILEYAQGGELFLHLATEKMFSEDVAAFYMASLVLALSHLHLNAGVIYRDLKPENCLLDASGFLLLTDFGLSKVKTDDSVCRSFLGTPEYMAPEVILEKEYDHAVDWWSLGALGVDLLTGSPPFTGNNNKKIADKILKQKLILPFYLSQDAKDLLTKLLRKDSNKRLGANLEKDLPAIKKHRFFRKIDWGKLERRELKPPIVPLITNPELAENFSLEFTSLACSPPLKVPYAPAAETFGKGEMKHREEEEDVFGGFSFVGSYGRAIGGYGSY